jgi:hypothetical protein
MEPARPTVVCASDGATPYLLFGRRFHVAISAPFTPRTPDPEKAPRPPTHQQPAVDKPGQPIRGPNKPKATFQWLPDCLWPFIENIRHEGWDGDA